MNPHLELDQIPTSSSESMSNLKLIFNSKNWAEKTKQAQLNLQEWGLSSHKKINLPDYFITDDVSLLSPEQMNPANYPIKKVIQSAPLLKYLKNMNVFSNNYLADSLFSLLGGSSAYAAFQKNKLKLSQKELVLLTGSGLPLIVNDQRRDNLGSCFAMIKVLSYIHNIAKESKLNLGSILLNPTSDLDGTFSASLQYNQAIVLKTGRLFDVPALNAVGFVSTTQGMLSFVFLGHDFSNNEADEIDQSRFEMIQNIFSHYQIQPQFISTDYKDIFL
jgi:D-alanyl-D-alanine carboxypeptidase